MMRSIAIIAALVLATAACSTAQQAPMKSPEATTSQVPTNTAGRPRVTADPCKLVPEDVLQREQIESKPFDTADKSDGDIEDRSCAYRPVGHEYRLSIEASNYTLDMDKKDDTHWAYTEFTLNGRQALSFYLSHEPNTSACAIDVAATTGVYGVLISGDGRKYGNFPDCLSAVRHYTEAFLPYFPS